MGMAVGKYGRIGEKKEEKCGRGREGGNGWQIGQEKMSKILGEEKVKNEANRGMACKNL